MKISWFGAFYLFIGRFSANENLIWMWYGLKSVSYNLGPSRTTHGYTTKIYHDIYINFIHKNKIVFFYFYNIQNKIVYTLYYTTTGLSSKISCSYKREWRPFWVIMACLSTIIGRGESLAIRVILCTYNFLYLCI